MGVTLISRKEGSLVRTLEREEIKNLASFNEMFMQKPGSKLQKTIDFVTCPGIIHLVHESEEQV